MRSISARSGGVLLLLLILAAPAQADAPTVLYRLGSEASFQEGCFGQCMCPVLLAGLRGTLGLTPAAPSGGFAVWNLSDIDWWIPELETPVTGSGTFRRSPGPDAQQQLVLDLSIGGEPVERYDSGVVPATARFPRIDALASLYDLQCYDRVFVVRAAPARPVTFRFRGEVSGVFDGLGALDPSVTPGRVLHGSFTFDPDTPNSALPIDEGEMGLYHHDRPPAGVRIRLGHHTFRSVPAHPDFDVIVNNDFGFAGADEFGFVSRNNEARGLRPSPPIGRLDIDWLASTITGNPLTSAELPLSPPDLDLLGGGLLTIEGECILCMGPAAFFRIEATLTSLTLPARISVDRDAIWWEGPEGATAYDVVSGDLEPLRAGDPAGFGSAEVSCLANDEPETTLATTGELAPGQVIWYLVRPVATMAGTYDSFGLVQLGGRDEGIEAQAGGCP